MMAGSGVVSKPHPNAIPLESRFDNRLPGPLDFYRGLSPGLFSRFSRMPDML